MCALYLVKVKVKVKVKVPCVAGTRNIIITSSLITLISLPCLLHIKISTTSFECVSNVGFPQTQKFA